MKRIVIAAAAALLMLGTAQAQQARRLASPVYGELGYSFLNVDVNGRGVADPQALRGVVGFNFHPFFAGEGMLAIGTASDNGVRLRHTLGVFAKPKFDFNNLEVFGRVGLARSNFRGASSESDLAYGLGVNYSFNPRTYVGADWMRYLDKDGLNVEGITINVGMRF